MPCNDHDLYLLVYYRSSRSKNYILVSECRSCFAITTEVRRGLDISPGTRVEFGNPLKELR